MKKIILQFLFLIIISNFIVAKQNLKISEENGFIIVENKSDGVPILSGNIISITNKSDEKCNIGIIGIDHDTKNLLLSVSSWSKNLQQYKISKSLDDYEQIIIFTLNGKITKNKIENKKNALNIEIQKFEPFSVSTSLVEWQRKYWSDILNRVISRGEEIYKSSEKKDIELPLSEKYETKIVYKWERNSLELQWITESYYNSDSVSVRFETLPYFYKKLEYPNFYKNLEYPIDGSNIFLDRIGINNLNSVELLDYVNTNIVSSYSDSQKIVKSSEMNSLAFAIISDGYLEIENSDKKQFTDEEIKKIKDLASLKFFRDYNKKTFTENTDTFDNDLKNFYGTNKLYSTSYFYKSSRTNAINLDDVDLLYFDIFDFPYKLGKGYKSNAYIMDSNDDYIGIGYGGKMPTLESELVRFIIDDKANVITETKVEKNSFQSGTYYESVYKFDENKEFLLINTHKTQAVEMQFGSDRYYPIYETVLITKDSPLYGKKSEMKNYRHIAK